jgi:hypothetical protein
MLSLFIVILSLQSAYADVNTKSCCKPNYWTGACDVLPLTLKNDTHNFRIQCKTNSFAPYTIDCVDVSFDLPDLYDIYNASFSDSTTTPLNCASALSFKFVHNISSFMTQCNQNSVKDSDPSDPSYGQVATSWQTGPLAGYQYTVLASGKRNCWSYYQGQIYTLGTNYKNCFKNNTCSVYLNLDSPAAVLQISHPLLSFLIATSFFIFLSF